MKDIDQHIMQLARKNIQGLKPYSSARDEAPEMLSEQSRIMLDANENSFGGPLDQDFSRYPDPQQRSLKTAFAKLKKLDPTQIFLGNGSDEAIDLLLRAFVEPGIDNIVLLPPTYGMYAVQANIHGSEIRQAPLRPDFLPDVDAVLRAIDKHSKLLFLCSPNNPTGQCLPEKFILEMLAKFPGLVVLDEAYIDFSSNNSWIPRLDQFPNLVILQTLSKAWGLAGLRIGAAFSNPTIVNILNKIKYPYNLNEMTIQLATKALSLADKMQENVGQIMIERQRLEIALTHLPTVEKVFPSDANFLLVRVKDADGLYVYLAQNGIIVRNRNKEIHGKNCLRITVGTATENNQLIARIKQFGYTENNQQPLL